MNIKAVTLVIAAALSGAALAQTPSAPAAEKPAQTSKQTLYGYQLMTDSERAEYRAKMRALKTPEERAAFRAEHHKLMQARAKERGITLPDAPPHAGMGQGMHQGMGQGMSQGQDMGHNMGQHMEKGMHHGQGMMQGSPQDASPPSAPASPPK